MFNQQDEDLLLVGYTSDSVTNYSKIDPLNAQSEQIEAHERI